MATVTTADGVTYMVIDHEHSLCSCGDTHGVPCPFFLPPKKHLCFRHTSGFGDPWFIDSEGNKRKCCDALLVRPENHKAIAHITRWRLLSEKPA